MPPQDEPNASTKVSSSPQRHRWCVRKAARALVGRSGDVVCSCIGHFLPGGHYSFSHDYLLMKLPQKSLPADLRDCLHRRWADGLLGAHQVHAHCQLRQLPLAVSIQAVWRSGFVWPLPLQVDGCPLVYALPLVNILLTSSQVSSSIPVHQTYMTNYPCRISSTLVKLALMQTPFGMSKGPRWSWLPLWTNSHLLFALGSYCTSQQAAFHQRSPDHSRGSRHLIPWRSNRGDAGGRCCFCHAKFSRQGCPYLGYAARGGNWIPLAVWSVCVRPPLEQNL